ncbi:hypothetical protein [Winogradskyella endarachnes]|uniref:Uncharacterized protein n=1 Tax=Winogradskyella endarachnes TaxID=2681965 RepID=A0A6L6UBT5_9FLAO|nr:hypothetical protein [Winogradskyella endarachnes]MUU79811.1 hypothetical protein [Winogradskyella endarachnes]
MSRKIEFPKIDKRTQKVVDRMSKLSDMNEKEEYEALSTSNVAVINELRKDIERNNKKSKLINIAMLLIALSSISHAIYKDFKSGKNQKELDRIESRTLFLEQSIENYQKQLHDAENKINLLMIEKNDSLN